MQPAPTAPTDVRLFPGAGRRPLVPAGLLLPRLHQLSQVGDGELHHSSAAEHGELGALGVGGHVGRALEDWAGAGAGAGASAVVRDW